MDQQKMAADIAEKIEALKQSADALARLGEGFPAVAKNTTRIQASIKMLELNVSDLVQLEKTERLHDL